MEKRPYTPPRVIDLSLEGVTGIGASACNFGGGIASARCNPSGSGAGATSCNFGFAAGGSCATTGGLPSYSGTVCTNGGSDTKTCSNGGTTSHCFGGTSAVYNGNNCGTGGSGNCNSGSTDAHFCAAGTSQAASS
ncbi:MAG: hypothetical protein HQK60_18455 [Deltaproteobacteria bacterium]|nr:hypothetical protein [Deltaproteobacteria bacterium]